MKIIVTGGAGFIGSHLVDRYIELGHEVVVIDNFSTGFQKNIHPKARVVEMDLSDTALEELVMSEKPDLINHHAAQINVRTSVDQPLFDLDINQRNTVRLLEAAKKSTGEEVHLCLVRRYGLRRNRAPAHSRTVFRDTAFTVWHQ